MKIAPYTKRTLSLAAVVLLGLVLVGLADGRIVRGIASFLIVEDPLEHAAAIVSLGGQLPFREMEAAKLYREGWAPQVIVVRAALSAEAEALQVLKIKKPQEWELSREVLRQQGVPASAIVIPKGEGAGTLEELQAVYLELVRREELGVRGEEQEAKREEQSGKRLESRETVIGHPTSVALKNAPNATTAKNVTNALPVILVTSKYHTRRTRLTWQYVTGGRSQAIVRAASGDPFDTERWWHTRRYVLSVVREYLGLINYYAGFPIGAGQ